MNSTPQEIAWHNVQTCDKLYNLLLFSSAALGWMKANPASNFVDLENKLRESGLETHLFCVEKMPPPIVQKDLINFNCPEKRCEWMLYFSCRPAPLALEEVLKNAPSYEVNLKRLATAGIPSKKRVPDREGFVAIEGTDKASFSLSQLLTQNMIKITVITK